MKTTLLTLVISMATLFVSRIAVGYAADPPGEAIRERRIVAHRAGKKPDPAFRIVTDDPKLPRVLLIGDSISIGYTEGVRQTLAGKANVHRVPENGGNTQRGLDRLEAWLGEKPWDVIHFNFGLHDLKRLRDGKPDAKADTVFSPEVYADHLEKIVTRLKSTGATLIWATTTPVPEGARGRRPGDDVRYNAAAAAVMARHGVRINDLHAHVAPRLKEMQRPKDVHFTPKGSAFLARRVADEITSALKERKSNPPKRAKTT